MVSSLSFPKTRSCYNTGRFPFDGAAAGLHVLRKMRMIFLAPTVFGNSKEYTDGPSRYDGVFGRTGAYPRCCETARGARTADRAARCPGGTGGGCAARRLRAGRGRLHKPCSASLGGIGRGAFAL